jgi:hypothetical protein
MEDDEEPDGATSVSTVDSTLPEVDEIIRGTDSATGWYNTRKENERRPSAKVRSQM